MRYLIIFVLLSGCAYTHVPKLSEPIENQAQFEADTKQCRSAAFQKINISNRMREDATPASAEFTSMFLGVLGGAVGGAVGGMNEYEHTKNLETPDQGKNAMQLTDDCMIKKGYNVIY